MRLFGIPYTPRQLHYALGDLLVALFAVYLAHVLRFGVDASAPDLVHVLDRNPATTLVFVGSTMVVLYLADAYNSALDFRKPREIIRLWAAVAVAVPIQFALYAAFPDGWWGRGFAALAALSLAALLPAWRALLCQVSPRPRFRPRTLVVGAGPAGRLLADAVRASPAHDRVYDLVGFVDLPDAPGGGSAPTGGPPLLGGVRDIEALVQEHGIQLIVVAVRGAVSGELMKPLLGCKARGILIEDMPTVYKRLTGKVPILDLPDAWLIFGPPFASTSRLAAAAERLADILLSLVGLVLSAPIVAVAALAVRMESKGPAFFLQERLGCNEQPFRIIKLRTMCNDAEARSGAVWSQGSSDPRVTRVGKFLRRSRIDELPQFVNVLRGEMSFVGPRPEREYFVTQLKERIPFYALRFAVKPGVTGWAQVKYRYGATEEDAAEKLCYEVYAIQEMSPMLYLLILVKTVQTVLLRPGS